MMGTITISEILAFVAQTHIRQLPMTSNCLSGMYNARFSCDGCNTFNRDFNVGCCILDLPNTVTKDVIPLVYLISQAFRNARPSLLPASVVLILTGIPLPLMLVTQSRWYRT